MDEIRYLITDGRDIGFGILMQGDWYPDDFYNVNRDNVTYFAILNLPEDDESSLL
jgi:hypothetical protein